MNNDSICACEVNNSSFTNTLAGEKAVSVISRSTFLGKEIDVYGSAENPLFLAKDVAEWIEYDTTSIHKLVNLVDEEEKVRKIVPTLGGNQEMWMLTEDGLYEVLMQSRKPIAKQFKKGIKKIMKKIRETVKCLSSIEYNGDIEGLVYSKNGLSITTSSIIAKEFNKNHKDILRAIDDKLNSASREVAQFCATHIKEIQRLTQTGIYREYELTECGFNFITLSLTGEKADQYKIRFIQSFDLMKQAIYKMIQAKTLEAVLPQDSKLRQYVYVIRNPSSECIKIGVAQDVEKRLKQLQTGAGNELEICYTSMICSNAYEIEAKAHSHFNKYRVFGEWFKVGVKEAILFIEKQSFKMNSNFNIGMEFQNHNGEWIRVWRKSSVS